MSSDKRLVSLWWLAAVFLCDQASKWYLERALPARRIIPGLLEITPLHNPNIFFGLWRIPHLQTVSLLIALLVFLVTLNLRRHLASAGKATLAATALGLIWGGMLGNTADRLLLGKVFDFIYLKPIPVFNLADIALTAGATLLILLMLPERRRRTGQRTAAPLLPKK